MNKIKLVKKFHDTIKDVDTDCLIVTDINDEISYGDSVFPLEVRLSTSRCMIVTFGSTLPSMNPKMLCSSFSFISDFFPSYALRLASNGESP